MSDVSWLQPVELPFLALIIETWVYLEEDMLFFLYFRLNVICILTILIQQRCIKLIKSYSKDIYNVTENIYFQ